MYTVAKVMMSLALLTVCVPAAAQTTKPAQQAGSVAGRITLAGKGVANASVVLYQTALTESGQPPAGKVVTDQEGRYSFSNIAPGQYTVIASTPGYVGQDASAPERSIAVGEGEEVEGVDFPLVRGAVITGRVTDPKGRPVIGEQVNVIRAGSADSPGNWNPGLTIRFTTDDRGIYRIFGLPAGRYVVAAGQETNQTPGELGTVRAYYHRTFHPEAAEAAQAKAVEVGLGGEEAGIDITLSRRQKKYTASGRVIDEATGKPVTNIGVLSRTVTANSQVLARGPETLTDAKGNFRIEGLVPGRYVALLAGINSQGMGEPSPFEITDKDLSGLEFKFNWGVTVTGQLVLSGTDDPQAQAQLGKLQLWGYITADPTSAPRSIPVVKVNPDGSFSVPGITPGNLTLSLVPEFKNFSILEIERDGVPQPKWVPIKKGEQDVNLKVVLGYGTGSVRGELKVENGELPKEAQVWAVLRAAGKTNTTKSARVDARGRFVFEGLASGAYDVVIQASVPSAGGRAQFGDPVEEKVTVTSGLESQVTLTLDLGKKKIAEAISSGR